MTYEELLSEIDIELRMSDYDTWLAGARALRAVVELHKPELTSSNELGCPECVKLIRVDDKAMTYRYPCPTIQAIEKELI